MRLRARSRVGKYRLLARRGDGAIASVLVAMVTWSVLFWDGLVKPTLAGVKSGPYLVLGMMPVTVMVAASTLTLIVVSLLTSPPAKSTVDRFFADA